MFLPTIDMSMIFHVWSPKEGIPPSQPGLSPCCGVWSLFAHHLAARHMKNGIDFLRRTRDEDPLEEVQHFFHSCFLFLVNWRSNLNKTYQNLVHKKIRPEFLTQKHPKPGEFPPTAASVTWVSREMYGIRSMFCRYPGKSLIYSNANMPCMIMHGDGFVARG